MPLRLGSLTPAALRVGALEVTAAYLGSNLVYTSTLPEFWEPSQLDGLALWLDADDASTITLNGSLVSAWSDRNASTVTFTQAIASAQPTYQLNARNNRPAIRFSTGKFLKNETSGLTNYRSLMVVYNDTSTAQYTTPVGTVYISTPPVGGAYHGHLDDTQTFSEIYTDARTLNGANFRNGIDIGTGITTPRPDNICVQTHSATGSLPQLLTTIGADDAQSTVRNIIGDIAEVILIGSALSNEDRQNVEGYLAWKWGSV